VNIRLVLEERRWVAIVQAYSSPCFVQRTTITHSQLRYLGKDLKSQIENTQTQNTNSCVDNLSHNLKFVFVDTNFVFLLGRLFQSSRHTNTNTNFFSLCLLSIQNLKYIESSYRLFFIMLMPIASDCPLSLSLVGEVESCV
jgi:hypothetical protein